MEQEARQRAAESITYRGDYLCGTASVVIRGMGTPAFLDLLGQVLPWRSGGHPEALQQLEALLVQRLPRVCLTRIPGLSHQRAPCWWLPKSGSTVRPQRAGAFIEK